MLSTHECNSAVHLRRIYKNPTYVFDFQKDELESECGSKKRGETPVKKDALAVPNVA